MEMNALVDCTGRLHHVRRSLPTDCSILLEGESDAMSKGHCLTSGLGAFPTFKTSPAFEITSLHTNFKTFPAFELTSLHTRGAVIKAPQQDCS